ncbi:hypothetical protein B0A52_00582 [Exophiala mesophila]|uniref:NAD(P)-binding protein n=1 Tax=Exophiala mesophila TaxID=212818 RepID=A0A438NHM5_EXOME|nr:hypothetical protein B0A52_00582 [Exophiala mesophila]
MGLSSFTKTYRKDTYPAIDPNRPELSAQGKTVIVAGAGWGGIGSQVAWSFAKAGALKIGLLGRTETTLLQTKDQIIDSFPQVTVAVIVTDLSQAQSVGRAAHECRSTLGAWDVFAHYAAVLPTPTTILGADEDEWWHTFEINTKSFFHFTKHFMPKASPKATFISCNAGAAHVQAALMPKNSAYAASKVAAAKLNEYLAVEHPALRVFTLHPGIIDTPMLKKVLASHGGELPASNALDTIALPAHFSVWLASPESEFLRGRYVWANWDVVEMMARKDEIVKDPSLLTVTIGGWPFQ